MNPRILLGIVSFLLVLSLALGVSLEYTVQANGIKTIVSSVESQVESCSLCENSSGNCTEVEVCENSTITTNITSQELWSSSRTLSLSCELDCDYPLPIFDAPDNVDVLNYTLSAKTLPPKVLLYFKNARSWLTQDPDDRVHIAVNTSITCSQTQCDTRCTKCLDGGCYPPGYMCPSVLLTLDKVSPRQLDVGQSQLSVFISNQYQMEITGVDAKVSGEGIKTLSSTPVDRIASKDKDAVLVTIKVDGPGTIGLLVKITAKVNGEDITLNAYDQVFVKAPPIEAPVKVSQSEMDEISKAIDKGKEDLNSLELEYQRKKADGYLVSELYDRVKYIRGLLQDAQKNLLDSKYIDTRKTLSLVTSSTDDLRQALQEAPKGEKKLKDVIKDNALLITTIIGTVVAIIGFLEKSGLRKKGKKENDNSSGTPKEVEKKEEVQEDKKEKWFSVEKVDDKAQKKKRR